MEMKLRVKVWLVCETLDGKYAGTFPLQVEVDFDPEEILIRG